MRIVLVAQAYPPDTATGGIGSQAQLKARGLSALGHDVTVLSCSPDEARHDEHQDGARVVRIPGPDVQLPVASDAVRWVSWSASVAVALAGLHAEEPVDVVDVPEYGGEGYVHLLNRDEGSPATVAHIHGPLAMLAHTIGWPDPAGDLYRVGCEMEAITVRRADAVIASSRCSADWCERHYDLPPDSAEVLHLGVDTDLFHPPPTPPPEPPVIAFAGRLAPSKGVDVLVEAVIQLAHRHPGLRLELHGRGDVAFVEGLRHAAAAAPGLLAVSGFAGPEELARRLRRAHVFAAPSLYEGGPGLVYLEAMASGLPVVGCTAGGVGEAVEDGSTGFLVAPGDVDALAEALDTLLRVEGLRAVMGARARAHVECTASTADCVRRLEQVYASASERVAGAVS